MNNEPKRYCAMRWIDGAWYSVEFSATDLIDAQHFCNRAAINFSGELHAKIPAAPGVGWLVRLWCWWRNRVPRADR